MGIRMGTNHKARSAGKGSAVYLRVIDNPKHAVDTGSAKYFQEVIYFGEIVMFGMRQDMI